MNPWDMERFKISLDGQEYLIKAVRHDISEQYGEPSGTVEMSHAIIGFEVPIYMITNMSNSTFDFRYLVGELPGGAETNMGLFAPLTDEAFDKAVELVSYIEEFGIELDLIEAVDDDVE